MIRQFEVYPTPDSPSDSDAPFVCILQSHFLDAMDIERRSLGRPRGSLLEFEYDIRRALDRLFTGF